MNCKEKTYIIFIVFLFLLSLLLRFDNNNSFENYRHDNNEENKNITDFYKLNLSSITWDDTNESHSICTTIIINEIFAGNPDYIEMYNYGPNRNMTGWYLEVYDDNQLNIIYTFPENWTFYQHTVVVLHENSELNNTINELHTSQNIYWAARPIALGLYDNTGKIVDWFQSSTHTEITPDGVEWVDDLYLDVENNYVYRASDLDSNKASDWRIQYSGSQGQLNLGQNGLGFPVITQINESINPLELGDFESFSVNAYDLEGINKILIEIDSNQYIMTKIGEYTWEYNNWYPSSTGIYEYTIMCENLHQNWYYKHGAIEVIDTTLPNYSYLHDSADPLELGDTETISISVSDISGINQVLIEFEENNHTMTRIGAYVWKYETWIPSSTGVYPYTINFEDNNQNWNFVSQDITVVDTIPPSYSNLIESEDPLELYNSVNICIDLSDPSGIHQVLIEINGINYTVENTIENTWEFNTWIPDTVGIHPYTVWVEDNNNNWERVSGSIQVTPDFTPPVCNDLVESSNPLELGNSEVIVAVITDLAGINQALIEYDGVNHSMAYIGNDMWYYNSWTPSSIGNYSYTIWFEDNSENWNNKTAQIEVKDTTKPTISNIVESANLLELGETEIISANAYDLAGINVVYININDTWRWMNKINDTTWQYSIWTPLTTGTHQYIIYAADNNGNYNFTYREIQVVDTIAPTIINANEGDNPLELGNKSVFIVKATDLSGINRIVLRVQNSSYDFSSIGGDNWQMKWTPLSTGTFQYTIYVFDRSGNNDTLYGQLEVIDTTPPPPPTIPDPPQGDRNLPIVFDWDDGEDYSGISYYRLVIDNESDPNITPGALFEINITESRYVFNQNLPIGNYYYFIYQIDGNNQISIYSSGQFNIIPVNNGNEGENNDPIDGLSNNTYTIWIVLIVIILSSVVSIGYITTKKNKNGTSKIQHKTTSLKKVGLDSEIEVKKMSIKKSKLENEAEFAMKSQNYLRAAELYEQCKDISNHMFKLGVDSEAINAKKYLNLKTKANSQGRNYLTINLCINKLMTEYGNFYGQHYYVEPKIYPDKQKHTDGLILNNNCILQRRLQDSQDEEYLSNELNLDPEEISHLKAIQFIFIENLSEKDIVFICENFEAPDLLLIIVALNWPNYNYIQRFNLPDNQLITYQENIRVINSDLFAEFVGLTGEFRVCFDYLLKSYQKLDSKALKKYINTEGTKFHGTADLKAFLIEKKLIKEDFSDYFYF